MGIKYHADNRNRAKIESILHLLSDCDFEAVYVQRDVEKWGEVELSPHALMMTTFELIRSCQMLVIDLTEKGVGLGIEAGYAHALGIPVITIAGQGADISTTLQGISASVFLYSEPTDLRAFFSTL